MTKKSIAVQAKFMLNGRETMNAWTFGSNQEVINYVKSLEEMAYTGKIVHYEVWVEHKENGAMIPYEQWLEKCGGSNVSFAGKFNAPKTKRIYKTFY